MIITRAVPVCRDTVLLKHHCMVLPLHVTVKTVTKSACIEV